MAHGTEFMAKQQKETMSVRKSIYLVNMHCCRLSTNVTEIDFHFSFSLFVSPNIDRIPARLVLYFLSWSGFLVSFMMRNDINIALVTMVRLPQTINETVNVHNSTNATTTTTNSVDGEFEWSTSVQSMILGSFYCCYVLSQVSEWNEIDDSVMISRLPCNFFLSSFVSVLLFICDMHSGGWWRCNAMVRHQKRIRMVTVCDGLM